MRLETANGNYDNCCLTVDRYVSGDSPAIGIWNDEGPIAMLTVCLGPEYVCGDQWYKDCSYVDTNNLPGAMDFINRYGLGSFTGIMARNGFCEYPLVKFDMDTVSKHTQHKGGL